MKRIVTIVCVLAASLIGAAAGGADPATNIGVLMWSEEPRYREALQGLLDQLGDDGFAEPAVRFNVQNARGGKVKLVEMARGFAAAKVAMVVSLGTSATLAAAGEIREEPVLFAYVYDPVEAGIVRGWSTSGTNVTGVSSKVSMATLTDRLQEFAPVTRLAVLYTPGEKNSEVQLRELQRILAGSPVKVVPVILSRVEEAAETMAMIVPAVDAIYISGSSVVGNAIATIVERATTAKVATVTHLDDMVEQGVLLGVCADPYLVGRLTGKMAVKVLKGASPASIPVESPSSYEVKLNMKTAQAGGFRLSPAFMKSVTKVIE